MTDQARVWLSCNLAYDLAIPMDYYAKASILPTSGNATSMCNFSGSRTRWRSNSEAVGLGGDEMTEVKLLDEDVWFA